MDKPDNKRQPAHPPAISFAMPLSEEAGALRDISRALFAMRDALTKLSLALKDWQFDHDIIQRERVSVITQHLMADLAALPKNRQDRAPP